MDKTHILTRKHRLLAVVLGCTLLLALGSTTAVAATPNGEADKTADQIVADALVAATGAKGVHVSGSGKSDGKPLALDLHLVAAKGGKGTVTADGLTFDIIRIGPKAYFRGDSKFWSNFGGSAMAELLKGKWLMASATTGDFASFTPLTDIKALMKQTLSSHGTLTTKGTTTIHGHSVITIVDTSKGGTLYVSATGKPYPVELTGGSSGTIDFDRWDEMPPLAAPAKSIDYAKLKK
jgi:hypothetical protein